MAQPHRTGLILVGPQHQESLQLTTLPPPPQYQLGQQYDKQAGQERGPELNKQRQRQRIREVYVAEGFGEGHGGGCFCTSTRVAAWGQMVRAQQG